MKILGREFPQVVSRNFMEGYQNYFQNVLEGKGKLLCAVKFNCGCNDEEDVCESEIEDMREALLFCALGLCLVSQQDVAISVEAYEDHGLYVAQVGISIPGTATNYQLGEITEDDGLAMASIGALETTLDKMHEKDLLNFEAYKECMNQVSKTADKIESLFPLPLEDVS